MRVFSYRPFYSDDGQQMSLEDLSAARRYTTQHLAKGVFQLHRGEREPFLKGGQEQKIVGTAIMQRQDRKGHIVSFQAISMVRVYLIVEGLKTG